MIEVDGYVCKNGEMNNIAIDMFPITNVGHDIHPILSSNVETLAVLEQEN